MVWFGGIFLEDLVQRGQEEVGVLLGEQERRPQLDHVVMRAVGAGEDSALAQPVHDVGGFERRGLAGRTIKDKPEPRTSPTSPWRSCKSSSRFLRCVPTRNALSGNFSSSSTLSTAKPAAQATGLPPKVVKNSIPFANDAAISFVVTTAASGKAFPIGLPSTTMSGTTPCVSNPQKCVPKRPNPTCTSSAIETAPPARTCL